MIYTYLRFNIYVKPLTHSQFKYFNTITNTQAKKNVGYNFSKT